MQHNSHSADLTNSHPNCVDKLCLHDLQTQILVNVYVRLAESVPILATSQAVHSFTITKPVLSNTLYLSHLANTAQAK